MKKNHTVLYLLAAFALPVMLLAVVLAWLRVAPFGDATFMRIDMNSQYSAFLTYLRSIVTGDNDLFYSFSMNGGGNFFFLFAYYLANPLNLFAAFFKPEQIPHAITFLIVVRFGLAGLTSCLYLREIAPEKFGARTLLFSTSYALMSYSVIAAENYFFVDGVVMLPLVLIGIERLFTRKTIVPYALALGVMLLIHFYIGYMICVFAVIYFAAKWFLSNAEIRPHAVHRFIIGSLLAGALASIILLPVANALSAGPGSDTPFWLYKLTNFPLFNLFSKNILGAYDTVEIQNGLPAIYAGAFITAFALAYFLNEQTPRKEKLVAGAVLLLLWVSFVFEPLNLIWHAFDYPTWWPYRYAFFFSFWMIRCGYLAFPSHNTPMDKSTSQRVILIAALTCALPLIFGSHLVDTRQSVLEWLLIVGILFSVRLSAMRQVTSRTVGLTALGLLVGINLLLNGGAILTINIAQSSQPRGFAERATAWNVYHAAQGDLPFARAETTIERGNNDALRFAYPGLTHYSSTYNREHNLYSLYKLGIFQKHLWTKFTEDAPLAATSFLSVRDKLIRDEDGKLIFEKSPTALPMAFFVPKRIVRPIVFANNPFQYLNEIYRNLSETSFGELYTPVPASQVRLPDETTEWTVTASDAFPIYLFAVQDWFKTDHVLFPDRQSEILIEGNKAIRLGTFTPGESILVSSTRENEIGAIPPEHLFYSEKLDTLADYAAAIQPLGVPFEKVSSSYLRGKYDSDGTLPYLFFSIPYDEGWSATIDGEKTLVIPALEHFIMIQAPAGKHTVELRYTPPGFVAGAAISGIAFMILIALAVWEKRKIVYT